MTISIKHKFHSAVPDSAAPSDVNKVRPSNWNDEHDVEGLGTAALLDAGIGPGNVVTLGDDGKLPAVDGSKLTNIPGNGAGISIKSYGAKVDGSTDDKAAVQAAIDANPGAIIVFPKGVTAIYGTVTISSANTRLVGEGAASIVSQKTVDVDTFVFKPTTAGVTSAFLSNVGIRHMLITHSSVAASHTQGAGIRFLQCNGYKLFDVSVNDAADGIMIEGGQFGSLKSFQSFASTGSNLSSKALLTFKHAIYDTDKVQHCYTTQVEDFRLSASKLRGRCIRIVDCDGVSFAQGYVALGATHLMTVQCQIVGNYVASCNFTNVYFDCVGSGQTPTAISIADDSLGTGTNVYGLTIGAGCTIGNADSYGIIITKPETMSLVIEGANFVNIVKWAVDLEPGSTNSTDLIITGCKFQNCGDAVSGAIRANTGRALTISANNFASITNLLIALAGNWSTGAIVGNVSSASVSELSNGATFSGPLVIAGNSGKSTSTSTSYGSVRLANVAVSDTKSLDWYEEGTGTVTLAFGGGSTGITYSAQAIRYTRVGNRVIFNLALNLTSKGSSTGTAIISGLPFTSTSSGHAPANLRLNFATSGVGDTALVARVILGTITVGLYKMGSGSEIALTDADLTNSTIIAINGTYEVA